MNTGQAGTFSGTAVLGSTDLPRQTFQSVGAMIYGFGVDKGGTVRLTIPPRVATRHEKDAAIRVLQQVSPGWKVQ